jgi:predicted AAA+ superfamily ATPase
MQNGVMYSRLFNPTSQKSFFLFGPRGTGKTSWLKITFPAALYLDLLQGDLYVELSAKPERLEALIPPLFQDWIILDEVQRIPEILNEVHRLIEGKGYRFILTGSSARSLRRKGANLLAGRALTYKFYPLTCEELEEDFNLKHALNYGMLPSTFSEESPEKYLKAYVGTYLREEVQQEGLTRNMGAFARFLETASFSQGSLLNVSEVAREAKVERKIAEGYFTILEDLLLATFLPVFTKRAKRRMVNHPKFYFFDPGVFRAIRPMGPFDRPEEADGAALETLLYQQLCALNDYLDLGYTLFYWRTSSQLEVDFVLYGPKGLIAFEIKRSSSVGEKDLKGLKAFASDYPESKLFLFYGGTRKEYVDSIELIPMEDGFRRLASILKN